MCCSRRRRKGSVRTMAEQTSASIVIDAPAREVMETIADLGNYPEWAAAVQSVEVLATGPGGRHSRARFVMDAGMVKDTYVLEYDWAADGLTVSWELVEGQIQTAQSGSYVLREFDGLTEVTYRLSVDLSIPMIGIPPRRANSITLMIFSPATSPSEPPNVEKSWA